MSCPPRPPQLGETSSGPHSPRACKPDVDGLLLLGLSLCTLWAPLGCSDSGARSTLDAAGTERPPVDAGSGRADAAARDASGAEAGSTTGPVYAKASATLVRVAPGPTVVAGLVDSADVDASTALWPVHGVATLRTTTEGVDLTVSLKHCRSGYAYPVFLYDVEDCSAVTRDSTPWDGARGTGIAQAGCLGAPGAFSYNARKSDQPKPWSLGGSAASNVLGRVLAVLDSETREPLACGVITESGDGAPARLDDERPRDEVVAQLTGACTLKMLGFSGTRPDGTACPDFAATGACAATHCYKPDCAEACAPYVACLEAASELCSSECEPSEECTACVGDFRCVMGFCESHLACATVTPGGPCAELESCCTRQGPQAESCLMSARQIQGLFGDATCTGLLNDFDFNTSVAHRSPCYQEGFGEDL